MSKAIALGGALWLVAAPASALPLQIAATAAAVEDARIGSATGVYRPQLQSIRYYRRGRSVNGRYRRGRSVNGRYRRGRYISPRAR
jgi:hypothetical protein